MSSSALKQLPASWRVIVEPMTEWPYVNPDENGLADAYDSLTDFTSDPKELARIKTDLEAAGELIYSEEEPWGKRAAETDRQYAMFSYFRALGLKRTRVMVARAFNVTSTTISKVSTEFEWDARIAAWDTYRERLYTAELLLGVKEMAHKHAEIAREGIEALSVAWQGIIERLNDPTAREELLMEIAEMPLARQLTLAQKTAAVIPNLMNAERLSRGLPTEISANLHSHDHRVTIQSTDDLADIISSLVGPLAIAQSNEIEVDAIEPDD